MKQLKFSKVELGLQKNNRFYNTPSIILTLSGCNLKCIDIANKVCKYAFEDNNISIQEAKNFVNEYKSINYIVIKGGEPLLYKEQLEQFLNDIWRDEMKITIYTNGTMPILNPFAHKYRIALYVVNLSQKRFPKPGSKIINPITGKKVIYGTAEIKQMQSSHIKTLRSICIYCSDYLLQFSGEPQELQQIANSVIDEICDTKDEALDYLLIRHSPDSHVVFVPRNANERAAIKAKCFEFGRKFNDSLY